MDLVGGFSFIVGFMVVAGLVAYIGDRVGHQVGRRRLTLFGLRPKYTSTIVAVATGMVIALTVILAGLALSSVFRNAVFRLGAVNAEIAALQSQAVVLRKEVDTTRNGRIVLPVLYPIANIFLTIRADQPDAILLPKLSELFDKTVTAANRQFSRPPYDLKPYKHKSSEPEIQADLKRELTKIRDDLANHAYAPDSTVLLAPVVGQNLFAGDTISFGFEHYVDKRIAAAGETLSTVDVNGGSSINYAVLQRLRAAAGQELVRRGFPEFFLVNEIDGTASPAALNLLPRLRGKYKLVARSSIDLYPHSGGVILEISLVPAT
ncbi:MAG: DUF3084 domain-containing protein [Candidatus Velthaea sp.]|jgi:hypothetical protein